MLPNFQLAVGHLKSQLRNHPEIVEKAESLGNTYRGRRASMVFDAVAARRRRYEYVTKKLVPSYEEKARSYRLGDLANQAPTWVPLRKGEAKLMSDTAKALILYGQSNDLIDDETICANWACLPQHADEVQAVLALKGIGPATLEYLRMLCGADSIKIDSRVTDALAGLGIPVGWFTPEGLSQVARELAREVGCSLTTLDQLLWHVGVQPEGGKDNRVLREGPPQIRDVARGLG